MKNLTSNKTDYQKALLNYYHALSTHEGTSGDLIWSSAVLMVVDGLPTGEKERRFVDIVLADAKEMARGKTYKKAA